MRRQMHWRHGCSGSAISLRIHRGSEEMARSFLSAGLLLGLIVATPVKVSAASNSDAKIAVHLHDQVSKNLCGTAPLPPCNDGLSSLVVSGQTGVGYTAYVLVLDGSSSDGIAGAAFGIDYGQNLYVSQWALCANLQFPGNGWPSAGSGNVVTWLKDSNCQSTPAVGDLDDGVTAVIGALYMYAYGEDVFEITRRDYVPSPDFMVVDCSAQGSTLPFPDHAGRVAFGLAAEGYDPCAQGDSIPPGNVEDLGGGGLKPGLASTVAPVGYLAWTAPADDGQSGGRALQYDLRYNIGGLDEESWPRATSIPTGEPRRPGLLEEVPIPVGLTPGNEYTFRVRAYDEAGNESDLSNSVTVVPPFEESFAETLDFQGAELWAAGHRVAGPEVIARFDGAFLFLNDKRISFQADQSQLSDETLLQTFGDVPTVQAALRAGTPISTAVDVFHAMCRDLESRAVATYRSSGKAAALQVLARSPLTTRVTEMANSEGILVLYQGLVVEMTLDLKAVPRAQPVREPSLWERAKNLVNELKRNRRTLRSELIVITDSGSWAACSGEMADQIKAQINHVVGQGSEASLPPGPWRTDQMPLREFVDVRREGGQ